MKEGLEEANISAGYAAKRLVSAGIVTFLYDLSRGIYPCGEFVFDLELDKVCLTGYSQDSYLEARPLTVTPWEKCHC